MVFLPALAELVADGPPRFRFSPINGSGMMSGISPLEKREDRPF